MRVYSRCRHCQSLLPSVKRKPDAFCDNACKQENARIVAADPRTRRASKKFNMAAVRSFNGTMWIQEPLFDLSDDDAE
jgi:hypothetical protein